MVNVGDKVIMAGPNTDVYKQLDSVARSMTLASLENKTFTVASINKEETRFNRLTEGYQVGALTLVEETAYTLPICMFVSAVHRVRRT